MSAHGILVALARIGLAILAVRLCLHFFRNGDQRCLYLAVLLALLAGALS